MLPATPPAYIGGHRIALRRADVGQADALFERCWSDPDVMQYQNIARHVSVIESRHLLLQSEAAWLDGEQYLWAVIDRGNRLETIGTVVCSKTERGVYSLGYALAKSCWGRGLATEGVGLIMHWLTHAIGVQQVCACCLRMNHASARVLKKVGFRHTGTYVDPRCLPNLEATVQRRIDTYVCTLRKT